VVLLGVKKYLLIPLLSLKIKNVHLIKKPYVGLEVDGQVAHSVSLFVTIFENTLLFALFLLL
jgi:hypothetical protein